MTPARLRAGRTVSLARVGWLLLGWLLLGWIFLTGCGEDMTTTPEPKPPHAPTMHLPKPGVPDDDWGPDALFDGIYIEWDPNEEPDLEGYRIYRSISSDGPFEQIGEVLKNQTFYEDRSVQREVRYYYRVTAFNLSGLESTASEIATYALLPVAVPVRPRNHAVVTDPIPIFDWISVGSASWYHLRVEASREASTEPWESIWISDPIYSFDHFEIPFNDDGRATEALQTGHEYRWRVDVVGDRTVGSESDWQYFTTEFPPETNQ